MLAAATHNLFLGGASAFLLNLCRTLPEPLRVVSFHEPNEHGADFAALSADVHQVPSQQLIYEDRLAHAYRLLAAVQPRALLACLGSESFELLRLAPPGVARIGLVQADDPGVYAMAAHYRRSLDAIVGVSTAIGEKLQAERRFRGVRTCAIRYGIAFAAEEPRPARVRGQPLRLLYLGRLIEEQKRISRLVTLVQRLAAQHAPVRLTLAGSGPQEAEVRAALAGHPLVSFRGPVPNGAVRALLREHDALVLLSDFEGLPLSLLEAMGEGVVPIVSALRGGMAEAVPEGTGFRVPVGDLEATERTILELAANYELFQHLSHNAAAYARTHFSAERMTAEYLQLVDFFASPSQPAWPTNPRIPAPHGVSRWLFSGPARHFRRWWKHRGTR